MTVDVCTHPTQRRGVLLTFHGCCRGLAVLKICLSGICNISKQHVADDDKSPPASTGALAHKVRDVSGADAASSRWHCTKRNIHH